jgi:hypothetical protein
LLSAHFSQQEQDSLQQESESFPSLAWQVQTHETFGCTNSSNAVIQTKIAAIL